VDCKHCGQAKLWSLTVLVQALHGVAWHGLAWHGMARHGSTLARLEKAAAQPLLPLPDLPARLCAARARPLPAAPQPPCRSAGPRGRCSGAA